MDNSGNTNSRVFIIMLGETELVYSSETGTISSVIVGSTQTQVGQLLAPHAAHVRHGLERRRS